MTKKHFIALANAVRDARNRAFSRNLVGGYDGTSVHFAFQIMLEELAGFCASQNGEFKRERWLGYINGECGPSGGRRFHQGGLK